MNLYRPVSIFKSSTVLADYIVNMLVTWNDISYCAGNSSELGAVYLKNVVLDANALKATVEAVHPITGELFCYNISKELTNEITAFRDGPVAAMIRRPTDGSILQESYVDLLPTVCIFDLMPSEMIDKDITINVSSPINVTVTDVVNIGIDSDSYILPKDENLIDTVCLKSINGINPSNGNILISGAGALTVSVIPDSTLTAEDGGSD